MCLVLSCRAADRYLGLKLKCGTKGSAWVRGTKPAKVPSRGGCSSCSDSKRQTDQGARRAMSPEYGDQNQDRWEKRERRIACSLLGAQLRRLSRQRQPHRGVHGATSCCAFQNKELVFCSFSVFFLLHLNCMNYLNA